MPGRLAAGFVWAALAASPALAAGSHTSLTEQPVATMAVVYPGTYESASAEARLGRSPVEIALAVVGAFDGRTKHIIQENDGGEAPRRSRVTVIRHGLLDDSVLGERWEIVLHRTSSDVWSIAEVRKAWRCRRGPDGTAFDTVPCP